MLRTNAKLGDTMTPTPDNNKILRLRVINQRIELLTRTAYLCDTMEKAIDHEYRLQQLNHELNQIKKDLVKTLPLTSPRL